MTIGFKANNDGSGAIQVNGVDRATVDTSGVLSVPAGVTANVTGTATALSTASGSAPSYAARAWVNFNGTGTVAIRASGNVSSITDNGTGDYTVNFTTAMPDANYSAVVSSTLTLTGVNTSDQVQAFAVGSVLVLHNENNAFVDTSIICVAIFR